MRGMISRDPSVLMMSVCLIAGVLAGGGAAPASPAPPGGGYADLLTFYKEFRAFQKPKIVNGVPDYTPAAMAAQQKELETYKKRLAAIDPSAWPIPQQVDYYVVRAEVNGLDFELRVLKPWANNPTFYTTFFPEESDQPKREGPLAEGAVELWSYKLPLSKDAAGQIAAGVRTIPALLAQAKTNLTGNGRDLWVYGAKSVRQQSADIVAFASKLDASQAPLKADLDRAKKATDDFAGWLDAQAASKTGPSGVGIENYNWYLKNVQLVPSTWAEEVELMKRELARSTALLTMEELKNAKLPPQVPIASAAEYDKRFNDAVTEYMAYLRDNEILTIKPWMDAALRARIGSYSPGPLEFFGEVDYRDPEVMRTHGYHWFDKGWMVHETSPNPIRRDVRLYNLDNTRTEGHATGWEELMMQAGHVRCPAAIARARVHPDRPARRAGPRRPLHGREPHGHRAGRDLRLRERAAGLVLAPGQARPRRAAPLPPAARLRDELPDGQDGARRASRRPQAAARRQVPHEGVHGHLQRRGTDPGVARAVGDDGEEVARAREDAEVGIRVPERPHAAPAIDAVLRGATSWRPPCGCRTCPCRPRT